MSKVLKVLLPKKCNGCELCIHEAQRQLGRAGPEGSFIRIFRDSSGFSIVLDPQVNTLDVEQIKNICPNDVFEVLDLDSYELLE